MSHSTSIRYSTKCKSKRIEMQANVFGSRRDRLFFLPLSNAANVRHDCNPFNPGTSIHFELPAAGHVSLKIYGVNGQLVKALASSRLSAGRHHYRWDGRKEANKVVTAGTYFYRIIVDPASGGESIVLTRKMTFLK